MACSCILDICLLITSLLFLVILFFYIKFKIYGRKYWAVKNITFDEPTFLIGNCDPRMRKSLTQFVDEYYFKHKQDKLVGIWLWNRPTLIITDVELMKDILVKNFSHFQDRGLIYDEKAEPLSGHLFNMNGQKWRNLRVKLTPTFTSGKMKMMYNTIYSVGLDLQKFLEVPAAESKTLEMQELLAEFTTDTISHVAFGIQTKSLGNPESDFRRYGRQIFEIPVWNIIQMVVAMVAPWVKHFVPLRNFPTAVTDFFLRTVKDVMEYREKNKVKSNDFLQLLIELKNTGKIQDVDHKYDVIESVEESGDPFTIEQAAAQAFVFFFAGFETSSTALMMALYELALNPDIQERLHSEIHRIWTKTDRKIDYTSLMEMEYLDQVVQETLRKYPPVGTLFRQCTQDYTVPNSGVKLSKDEFVLIPLSAVQNDPEYFPNPSKFDPDRFSSEQKADRDSFLNLFFGSGPRICIGPRFAMMQVKIGMVMIFSTYKIEVATDTPIPIKFNPKSFVLSPPNGMPLKISKR